MLTFSKNICKYKQMLQTIYIDKYIDTNRYILYFYIVINISLYRPQYIDISLPSLICKMFFTNEIWFHLEGFNNTKNYHI